MIFNLENCFSQHLIRFPLFRKIAVKFLAMKDDFAEGENQHLLVVPVEIQKMNSKNYYLNQY